MKLNVEFVETENTFTADFSEFQQVTVDSERYAGAYEVTPARYEQKLNTADKLMQHDVVIHAIPKEYGLVTYNQDRTITIT